LQPALSIQEAYLRAYNIGKGYNFEKVSTTGAPSKKLNARLMMVSGKSGDDIEYEIMRVVPAFRSLKSWEWWLGFVESVFIPGVVNML
jgi:hypothetical protein